MNRICEYERIFNILNHYRYNAMNGGNIICENMMNSGNMIHGSMIGGGNMICRNTIGGMEMGDNMYGIKYDEWNGNGLQFFFRVMQ